MEVYKSVFNQIEIALKGLTWLTDTFTLFDLGIQKMGQFS